VSLMSKLPYRLRICLITTPLPSGLHVLVENFLHVLEPLAKTIYLVTGNYPRSAVFSTKIHVSSIGYDHKKQAALIRVVKNVVGQLRLSLSLARVAHKTDVVIFFLASPLLLPMLAAKSLGKKVVLVSTGSWSSSPQRSRLSSLPAIERIIFLRLTSIEESLNYHLCDSIVVYTPSLVRGLGLEKYRNKVLVAYRHFTDSKLLSPRRPSKERGRLVGYIGRLSEEKGILNLIEAIPPLLETDDKICFLIGGDGHLRSAVEEYLSRKQLRGRVDYVGWVPHERVPDYLNELRLLILPSYSEGLPNIMLEAMACGTVVLATPVGGIPDVIRDGVTGFIMEDNSVDCIARNIARVLNHEDLEQVAGNARALVEKEYTYQSAVERYGLVLSQFVPE